ncbi:uncharacterized protein LOC132644715 [Lycium barbarum]|uniref:uncharacterized protein LOC132644715 n=1 Tax=Lycium barbarum TaxID=112863 RepID=UPI00293EA626|nr:uncharacterized protein LOC132644715 [Lycium barbarum]
MSTISSLIRHSGNWNNENCYVNFKIDAVAFKEYSTYIDLLQAVATQLNIDMQLKNIYIKYIVEGNDTPMEIHNDMSVRVCVELKKDNKQLAMYPLCITTTDKKLYTCVSGESCIEGGFLQIGYIKQTNAMETVVSGDLASSSCGNAVVVFENDTNLVISDKNQKEVVVDQVYKDKDTLKAVMANYAISNRFNFRAERSNAISYTLVCVSEECDWKFRASSVGSHIRMRKSDKNEFLYLFIALYAFIKGFDCCRPIVVVDGSHLKTAYNGTFVSASTLDGAGNILPLAYGVIDSENDRSWTWFFERFREAYGVRENMCIVSDRHESINKAVSRIYPNVPHYACIWHLWGNVCKKYKKSHDVLSPVFYAMAKAYTQEDFDELMGKVEKADFRVAEYLELAGREKWARVYATANRGWTMTSNIAECINRHLVAARELPIFDFLEEVRKMFGRWNYNNRKNGIYTFTTLGKKFQEMLSINEYLCLRMTAEPSTEYLYTVYDAGRRFIVNLDNKTCSCRMFQIDEIPCPHAWAVIKKKNLMVDDYCFELFKRHTVVKTYDVAVDPLPDEREWKIPTYISEDVVLPPRYKRPPGRPKKKRDKPLFELLLGKKRHACITCGQTGHNRRSCSNTPRRK